MLQGIFDDRGKFIYLSEEEIESLKENFNNKGKMNRQEMIE